MFGSAREVVKRKAIYLISGYESLDSRCPHGNDHISPPSWYDFPFPLWWDMGYGLVPWRVYQRLSIHVEIKKTHILINDTVLEKTHHVP